MEYAITQEKERDKVIEILCQAVVAVEHHLLHGRFSIFDADKPSFHILSIFEKLNVSHHRQQLQQSQLQRLKGDPPSLRRLGTMSQGASDASPLLLACERNAPLATIRCCGS